MSLAGVIAQVLLWAGVGAELICCLGVWWMQDVFDRLHYAAAATTVGPLLIGVSVAMAGTGTFASTVEAVLATAVLVLVNPMVTHATGRAARRLLYEDIGPDPEQLGGDS